MCVELKINVSIFSLRRLSDPVKLLLVSVSMKVVRRDIPVMQLTGKWLVESDLSWTQTVLSSVESFLGANSPYELIFRIGVWSTNKSSNKKQFISKIYMKMCQYYNIDQGWWSLSEKLIGLIPKKT